MTITTIMHVTGAKADLYSSSYFKKVEGERLPVNPFSKWIDGHLYAFGTVTDIQGTTRIVVDLTLAQHAGVPLTGSSDDPMQEIEDCLNNYTGDISEFYVTNHPIPTSRTYINWFYQYKIKEYQTPAWYGDQWNTYTASSVQYIDNDGNVITPSLTSDTVAKELTEYYYNDKWNFSSKMGDIYISLTPSTGDDLTKIMEEVKQELIKKYPTHELEIESDLHLYSVDITKAKQIDNDTVYDSSLMGYWLGKYDAYPTILSVDQTSGVIATFGHYTEPNMDGDFEYRHALPDAVFDFSKDLVNRSTVLPICNGLCCYPRLVENRIYAHQGQRLSYNKRDRNRRWVLVDFNPVGGCSFIPLKNLKGTMSELILEDYDNTKQSVLLVVKGRLFTPDEFEIINNKRLLFNLKRFDAVYELDRKLCRGDLRWNAQTIDGSHGIKVTKAPKVQTETINVYEETSDTEFKKDTKYYIQFHGDYIEVDVSGLIGEPIDKTSIAYTGFQLGIQPSEEYDEFSVFYNYNARVIYDEFYSKYSEAVDKEFWYPSSSVMLETTERKLDLKNDDNSFLIVINKPGLQVVRHRAYEGSRPMTRMKWGTDTFGSTMKVDFSQQARGLLFDESTRSVCDYTRETQTMTFYVDKIRKWGISSVTTNWQSLISMTDESVDNFMSARGFVINHVHSDKYDHVVWPRMSILDFIFRG